MNLNTLLAKLTELKGSDLFITVDKEPCIKSHGKIVAVDSVKLTHDSVMQLILEHMPNHVQAEFERTKEANFAIQVDKLGRFRVSAFYQRALPGAVIRRIENIIPSLEELCVPNVIKDFSLVKRGLVIFVGATGAGKSSTLAAMINHRNENLSGHIITIEDPIEFVHAHKGCIITQREVGLDTESFEMALKNALRQAPDVILIGEVRSKETMNHALHFAETGHLCLATLHANTANQALDRIINFFPAEQHKQVWIDLSLNLKAIVAQQLIPLKDSPGRIPAVEILINTPVIAEHIKNGDVYALQEFMAKDTDFGMQTFDQALFDLYQEGKISYEEALKHATSENELRLMVKLSKNEAEEEKQNNLKLQDL